MQALDSETMSCRAMIDCVTVIQPLSVRLKVYVSEWLTVDQGWVDEGCESARHDQRVGCFTQDLTRQDQQAMSVTHLLVV